MKEFKDSITMSIVEFRKYYDALQRVRELHSPWTHTFPTGIEVTYCRCNAEMYEDGDEPPYPCPTIKALDGE